jgi:hypothetical protein
LNEHGQPAKIFIAVLMMEAQPHSSDKNEFNHKEKDIVAGYMENSHRCI